VPLLGTVHLILLAGIAAAATALVRLCRRGIATRATRLLLGYGLAFNELAWWAFRYSHEGLHFRNLPLQLCDITLWMTVLSCLTLCPLCVDFAYFAGFTGSGMALLTPDLWAPWPSYPAIYFFVAHGGTVAAIAILVFGRIASLRAGAIWRAYGMLLGYSALAGTFDAIFGTNFMYLCRKPGNISLLDVMGPWPVYLASGAAAALLLFWLLWLPVQPPQTRAAAPSH
jgi:hypothetical integral membrane protein (TIGR02206 family)